MPLKRASELARELRNARIPMRRPLLAYVRLSGCRRPMRTAPPYFWKHCADCVPRHVVYRQKVGLDTPMSEWLKDRESLGGMLDNLLARQGRGCFDPDVIRELRKRHEQGVEDSRVVLWFLASFEMWAQHFLDNEPSRETGAG